MKLGKEQVLEFWARVKIAGDEDCWNWSGMLNNYGYGMFWVDGGKKSAHRISYEMLISDIPSKMVVDHLCRNRKCVNPRHMEIVTNSENVKRGERSQKTHCIRGHLLSGNNLRIRKNGTRFCRECDKQRIRTKRKEA